MTLLAVESLDARHGLLQAVRDVSLTVDEGETVALVGANGAGKTTLLRTIAGRPPAGRAGASSSTAPTSPRVPAHRRVRLGIALVPEGRRLFPGLTVEENLLTAAGAAGRAPGMSSACWRRSRCCARCARDGRDALGRRAAGGRDRAGADEQSAPAAARRGLAGPGADRRGRGLRVAAIARSQRAPPSCSVEQDLARAMGVAARVVCMLEGRVVLEGATRELTREQITAAYFGLRAQPARESA